MKKIILFSLIVFPFIAKAQLGLSLDQLKMKYNLVQNNNTYYTEDNMCVIEFELSNNICISYTLKSKTETSDDFILFTLKEYRVVNVNNKTLEFIHNKNNKISCTLTTGEKFIIKYFFNKDLK